MNTRQNDVEVLTFYDERRREFGTIVTDGERTKSFTSSEARDHKNLGRAIAHLEVAGYHIITDSWI